MARAENVLTRKGFAHVTQFTSHTTSAARNTATKRDVQKRTMK